MTRSLDQWLSYIRSLHPVEVELGLERIIPVANKLAVTEFNCPVIVIGGTNGKGSCVALMDSIYRAAGYQVGCYTSPHLLSFNERIMINQQAVSDEELCQAFAQVEEARADQNLTCFEFYTLATLLILQNSKLDVVLLEVGLGGRLDAVNIVKRDLSLISTISYDHMDRLGNDLNDIAREKAGIFSPHIPAVCGSKIIPPIVKEYARQIDAPLYCLNQDYRYQASDQTWNFESAKSKLENLPLPSLLLQNAATVLMGVTLLQKLLPVDRIAIEQGLISARVPGRFEVIKRQKSYILDVAHNPESAEALAQQLKAAGYHRVQAVVSILTDKDIIGTLKPLQDLVSAWYVAGLPDTPRGANSAEMMTAVRAISTEPCYNCATVEQAFNQAAANEAPVLVFGSFYTVAAVKKIIRG